MFVFFFSLHIFSWNNWYFVVNFFHRCSNSKCKLHTPFLSLCKKEQLDRKTGNESTQEQWLRGWLQVSPWVFLHTDSCHSPKGENSRETVGKMMLSQLLSGFLWPLTFDPPVKQVSLLNRLYLKELCGKHRKHLI